MTTPGRPGPAGDLEPGWSHGQANPYGPCYQRHIPGKGIARVVARGAGRYAWYLSTTVPSVSLSQAREGFTGPRQAMRDADGETARMPLRMFERLTPGQARELYRRLHQAYAWGGDAGRAELSEIRGEVFRQIQIHACDPSYDGPDPDKFRHAVRLASYDAPAQAMRASPNRRSWLSMPARPQRARAAGPPSPAGPRPGGRR